MKLFLASEGKLPESINKFKEFLGEGLSQKSIAFIPTAGNGDKYGGWQYGETVKIVKNLSDRVNIIELEDYSYKGINVVKEIAKNDIIWMNGGMSGYLLYWIRRVELDKALPEILNNGTIYYGSSSGSMVCAKTQYSAEWFIGEEEPGAGLIPGLGYVDFEIYPHFGEHLRPEIERRWKKGKLVLLKNGEVITKVDDKIEILGEERIIEK